MSEDSRDHDARPADKGGLSVWQVVKSTLAAAFGVQTPQARERDFRHGNPLTFIVAGIVFTAIFVVVLVVIVNLVLTGAGTG